MLTTVIKSLVTAFGTAIVTTDDESSRRACKICFCHCSKFCIFELPSISTIALICSISSIARGRLSC
ncbi:hypothetical protein QUB06_18575 [Microcoleus sp. D2_18a_D3]